MLDMRDHVAVALTPLMLAAKRGHVETVKLLLAKGADVNAIVKDNLTALAIAVQHNNAAVVRLLLAGGADARAKDLLYLAAGAPWVTDEDKNPKPELTSEILQLLLDKGANAKSPDGDRALMAANSVEKTKLLLADHCGSAANSSRTQFLSRSGHR